MANEVRVQVDSIRNGHRGRTSLDSLYFTAATMGRGSVKPYQVTLNYSPAANGHWCTCKGMISKRRKYGSESDPNVKQHWCKHIQAVMEDELMQVAGVLDRAEQMQVHLPHTEQVGEVGEETEIVVY
jgi:hypothetical protein